MKWLVAYLSPTAPKSVYSQLVLAGHGAYVPTCKEETVFRGKPALVERPLVKGYVFLRYTHRWPDANEIEGVKVLTFDTSKGKEEAHTVSEEKLKALENMAVADRYRPGDGSYLHGNEDICDICNGVLKSHAWLESLVCPGGLLVINGGEWSTYIGTFKRRKHGQAILDIDFMHRTVEVSVPLHLLARPHGASTAGETRPTASAAQWQLYT